MPRPDPLATADALHRRGRDLTDRGQTIEAARTLRRALRLTSAVATGADAASVRVRVLRTLAFVEAELRDYRRGMFFLDEAEQLLERFDLETLRVSLFNQRGIILLIGGRQADAIVEFDRGLADRGGAPDTDRIAVLQNRATAQMELGAFTAARADLQRCLELAAAADDRISLHQATHQLGVLDYYTGDLPSALRHIDAAAAMDAEIMPGSTLVARASVLAEAGLLREADEALAAASVIFRRERLTRHLAEAQLERSRCTLAAGDIAAARRHAAAARDRFRRHGSDSWRRESELALLQADLAAGRPGRRLIPPALRLRDELRGHGVPLAARQATLILAEAQLAAGEVAAAAATLAGSGPVRSTDPITGRMHSHLVRARVTRARGERGAAVRVVRGALADLAHYQARFGSMDLRTAVAVHGRQLGTLDIELALETDRPAAVFDAAERARAMAARLPPVHPPDDALTVDLLGELRQVLQDLGPVEQDRYAAAPLLRRRRELERRIVARSWTIAGPGTVGRNARLPQVRAALARADTVLITYVQTADALWAVVVGDGAVRMYELGATAPVYEWVRRVRADLDAVAAPRLAGGLRAAVRGSLERALKELETALLAPVRRRPGAPLVIVSTGELGKLPWTLLPALRGVPVTVASSATKWLASVDAAAGSRHGVVAVAGPDLERAGAEIAAVGAHWPRARVLTGSAATRSAVIEALGTAEVLHVAAHGVHESQHPLFSALRLVDGPVFAHELDGQAAAPPHVVLSACEVGLATVRPGDEALGLASALLQLGTRSVIASVARVGDETAAAAMAAYHHCLAQGLDTSAALAAALADLDAPGPAPFVTFGASVVVGAPAGAGRAGLAS